MSSRSSGSVLARYARDLGWRAYAIPVLVVITVWVLFDVFTSPAETDTMDGAVSATSRTENRDATEGDGTRHGPNPADDPDQALPINQLPPGGPFTEQGEGTFRTVGTPGMTAGEGLETVIRYVVEVEDGVDTAGSGGDDALAAMIDATLSNPKGWTNDTAFRFEHVAPDQEPTMRIQLTSVGTTRELCGGLDLEMETSCHIRIDGVSRVLINESRWVRGAAPFNGDLGSYRQYLVNHEVGHGLGYAAHEPCGADGELAPIMMQQTLSLNNAELHAINPDEVYPDENVTCRYNPWPYPRPVVL
ncbi:hypothetical protein B842_02915 [Corynebacterium humireducens NBRC 106098 = DSM 45392]|uniref:DUF3152 domain-containing protein n=1 Tax=Corynebacterium humireducens NBRC 106098 = DSM 45392 TaxID=1223515 RepID=A0A0B5D1E6_9CORY|nr:DUF3152 domain-containing protein [Corynebacterium humireducens]AJE32436.1 hypothetical protein B842_02915 [Corynebacterium humireducens NBRC 106098 = DSM 45392]